MRWIPLLPLILLVGACSHEQRSGAETSLAKALISDDQEKQLGAQVKQQLDKQGTKYVTDPEVLSYVQGVANRVLAFAKKDRPDVDWHVYVIDDPKTVNAFATPGGYLFVYTGLLLTADNEAELAGVWGHESGHVVARHSARQMVDQFGLEAILGAALGQNPGTVAKIAGAFAEKGTLLAHSRGDEDDADEYGARYASAAGYDPHGLVTFFEKLAKMEGQQPSIAKYLSDHPLTTARIQHIERYIDQNHLVGSEIGAERLAPIKARLRGAHATR